MLCQGNCCASLRGYISKAGVRTMIVFDSHTQTIEPRSCPEHMSDIIITCIIFVFDSKKEKRADHAKKNTSHVYLQYLQHCCRTSSVKYVCVAWHGTVSMLVRGNDGPDALGATLKSHSQQYIASWRLGEYPLQEGSTVARYNF